MNQREQPAAPLASPSAVDLGPRVRGVVAASAIGVLCGATAVLGALLLLEVSAEVGYAPMLGAVVIAVWVAGRLGAIAAIVVGWALTAWAILPPKMEFDIASRDERVRWLTSLAVAVVIGAVGYGMRRGHERAALAAGREEQSRLRVERLQVLAAALSAALTVEEVAGVMVDGVPVAIGARGGALGLIDGDDLVIVDPRGAAGQTLPPGSRMALTTRAPITAAAKDGEPAWAQRRAEFVSRFPDGAALVPYASGALAVPVFVGEHLAGAMGFPFADPDAVTVEVRTLARIAADLGGQALERAGLYEQERSSREALDRILAVAPRFQRASTPEAIAASVCAEARRAFGCDVVQVWTPIDDDRFEVTWRDPPTEVIPPGTQVPFENFPGLLEEMREFRSMFVPNAQLHTRGEGLRHAKTVGVFSSLRIPVVIGAQFERVLALQWERVIPEPAPPVVAVMRRFADQAGLALEQGARRRAQDETRALQAVTEALAAAATPADVGSAIVRQGVAALGARSAAVFTLSEDGHDLELVASEGYSTESLRSWERIALDGASPLAAAIRSGEAVTSSARDNGTGRDSWLDPNEESILAAPLVAGGRAIGGIYIGSLDERPFTADPSVAVGLTRQAAQALDRAQLFERQRASVDRLRKLQRVTAALSQAVTIEDVCRTCLEHAVTGIGAVAGLIVLPASNGDHSESGVGVVAAIGLEGPDDAVPESAAEPIASCVNGRASSSGSGGWIAFSLAGGALAAQLPAKARFPDADRQWLLTMVSQSQQALDRAGRYETERGIAETMQRSVLPERLPHVSGITLAARYLPGTVGVDVGGDWYDVIQFDDGRIGLVVGDVVGKGVRAASIMGQLRNALRAFAFEYDDPYEVVVRLGRLVEGMLDDPFATLAYLVIDPCERRVRYVVAGHPPPLVRAPDGGTSFLESGRALPIGVDASLPFESGHVEFEEGAAIVLYTDGLVERRDAPLDEGLATLAAAVSATDGDPERVVDAALVALVGENERPDDIAILALRFTASVVDELHLDNPTTQEGLVEMRTALREWLASGNVGPAEAGDAVLAVWEACANAVEHAQQPLQQSFSLRATLDDAGRVRFAIRDSGQWKDPSDGVSDRGMGLGLMRSLMDTVAVTPGEGGTEVVMERQLHVQGHV